MADARTHMRSAWRSRVGGQVKAGAGLGWPERRAEPAAYREPRRSHLGRAEGPRPAGGATHHHPHARWREAVHDLLTTNVQVEGLDPSYTGTTAIAIVHLPLPPGAEARALLHHLLEHGHVVGRDIPGRTIIQLVVDDWTLERLMTFDAEAADLEDADAEPEPDDEEDGPPVVVDLVGPKVIARRRPSRADQGPTERPLVALRRRLGRALGDHRVPVFEPDSRDEPVPTFCSSSSDRRDARLSLRDQ